MRFNINLFLAKANLNGSRRKKSVMVMMVLSVISVITLIGFLSIVNSKMEISKQRDIVRQIYIMPQSPFPQTTDIGITADNINDVLNIEHVVSCEKRPYANYQLINITKITNENGKDVTNSTNQLDTSFLNNGMNLQEIDKDFSAQMIEGESLKNAPVMSCILPHYYLTWDSNEEHYTDELLGKTISVDCSYLIHLYNKNKVKGYDTAWETIAELKYSLKVVGIYYFSRESSPTGATSILISPETAVAIENMALEKCQEENKFDVSDYINDPYARDYIVTVDNYDNVGKVEKEIIELGFNSGIRAGYLDDAALAFSAIFNGAGTFLAAAIILLTVINIFLSVHNNISDRKAEIGLMKALGYKTSRIFYCMYLENIILAVRSVIIGGVISAVIVGLVNLYNSSGSTIQRIFVMPWQSFALLFLLAFTLVLVIPFLCQLIMVSLLAKIQPQEAMNS